MMKKSLILFAIIAAVVIGFFLWWQNGMQAPNPLNKENAIFVINKGEAIRQVGNDLKEQGFIKDPVIFFLYVKKEGIDTSIQAGSYRLSPSMTLPEVIDTLQHGTIDVWVTIPEGYRAEEIAETLSESLTGYDEGWVEVLKENEGYLFPDTYLIPNEATVDNVVAIMRGNFDAKVASLGLNPPNIDETVTIASLIEREAITDEEKPLISSVIHNRLNSGMALDIDATLQYVKGKDESGNWWSVPTGDDRRLNSPYNTYTNAGLPPTPIANPGIVAIQAALNPEDSPYYFYIHDPEGNVHFAETLDEHNENIEQYLN